MSRSDLRALFRSNDRDLKAVEFFADRRDEWDSVARSITRLVGDVREPSFDVEDLEAPRHNVLAFYGTGGIGKSTFSRQVADQLAHGESAASGWVPLDADAGRLLPVRVDLSRDSGADFETVMLAIRLAVAELGRPMPAFDLAFQRYWERHHPGEPIDDYVRRRTWFSRFSAAGSLPDQMQSVLSDLAQTLAMPGTAGAVVGQGLKVLVRALREHRHQVRALAECRRLADLLEAEPDLETLSYCAHLLAWDLSRLPEKCRATPVILLDTFEDVGDRVHRDFERLLQRVAWLMPNALFIITGRNRLEWANPDLEGQLDWSGPRYWPLLAVGATDEPRQHTVGYLSAEDCDIYLCQRLTVNGRPLMDDRIRHEIIANSHGLPLYLDLAVMRFLDLYRIHERSPEPEEFRLDFPALVARTFRDLSTSVRYVLRSVSLLDSFSVELAAAAAGLDHDAPALELVDRPFIDHDPSAPWPYRLHDLVRETVRDADSTSDDRWSAADWARAAQRAFDALGKEAAAAPPRERARAVSALRQGMRLARDFDLDLGWLADAAYRYVDDFVWEPIEIPPAAGAAEASARVGNPAQALATALSTIARRQRIHRGETAEQLRQVVESGLLPDELLELPRYFLAECNRDLGNFQESLDGMQQVVDGRGRMAATAARGLVHLARRMGRFPQVRAAAEALGTEGRGQRVLGDLWWTQGSIALACAGYAGSRDQALDAGQQGEAALSQACLAFAAAFQDRARATEQIQRAEQLLQGASIRWADIHTQTAGLIRDAGADGDMLGRADAVALQAHTSGLTSSIAYIRFAECLHGAVRGEASLLADARDRLLERVRGDEFAYLLELSYLMAGEEAPADLPRAQWLDGIDQTSRRWQALVADRRHELAVRRGD